MRKMLGIALAAAGLVVVGAPAQAADGCGRGGHRGPYGHCRPNRGPMMRAGAPVLVVGNFYRGHGYWDGRRYWQRRERWHGGWRYR